MYYYSHGMIFNELTFRLLIMPLAIESKDKSY